MNVRSTSRRLRRETRGNGTPDIADAKKRAKSQLATARRRHGEAVIEEALNHMEEEIPPNNTDAQTDTQTTIYHGTCKQNGAS